MIEYIKKKFYVPLMTSIQEVTGEGLDVEFVTPSIIEKREKELKGHNKNNVSSSDSSTASENNLLINNKKLEANLNPNYTFENFVVGGNNNYAHAYALAVAESPAEVITNSPRPQLLQLPNHREIPIILCLFTAEPVSEKRILCIPSVILFWTRTLPPKSAVFQVRYLQMN